jgi:hypothetical protein
MANSDPTHVLGESGKNFIEIGKRFTARETMLNRAVPFTAKRIFAA